MTENLFYKIYNTDGQLLMNTMNMHGMMAGMDRETESYQTAMYDVTVENISSARFKYCILINFWMRILPF